MHLIAHHAAEQSLAPLLLLLGSGGLPLVVAIGRAQVAAARARLTRKRGSPPRLRCRPSAPLADDS